MPRASVTIAVTENALFLKNVLSAYRTSPRSSSSRRIPTLARATSFCFSIEPNSIRARRCASAGGTPRRARSAARASIWNRISSSIASSNESRCRRFRAYERSRANMRSALRRTRPERGRHRRGGAVPAVRFLFQPLPAGGGQRVELRPTVVVGHAPFHVEQSLVLETIERRVQRALLH